jgi:hypothetical protein
LAEQVTLNHDRREVKDAALPNTLPILSTGDGYTAADGSDSGPDHDSNGHNNAGADDVGNSLDKSEPPYHSADGANCQIHWNSYNDCSWREREAFLQIGECRTGFD